MAARAMQLPIPTGTYASPDVRSSARRLINCFSEQAPQDNYTNDSKQKQPPVVLRRAYGIDTLATDGTTNACRGAWAMQGVEYVVIGPTLYTMSSAGVLSSVGTGIPGSGFVRMTDNSQCLVILLPGTKICWTYDLQTTKLKQLTAAGFVQYGAIDCWFIDSYIVFLALNGREFFNDDGQANSGTGQITFNFGNVFAREFGTDNYVGGTISNRNVYLFGERTSEIYVDTGASTTVGSPFSDAPNGFIQIGMCIGAQYSAVNQNNTVYWIANDRTVRTMNGVSPVRVSNHGIEGVLAGIDMTGMYGFAYSMSGHLMVAWTFPAADAGRTLVYDCTTGEWHEMSSYGLGYWRPLCCHNAFGKYLVGDSQGGNVGVLDLNTLTEWGTQRSSKWIHQSVYQNNNRLSHRRLELVLGGGFAPLTGAADSINPVITLLYSDDGGETFRSQPMRSLGTTGQYNNRIIWFGLGIARQRVYAFEISSAAESWITDLVLDAEMGRW